MLEWTQARAHACLLVGAVPWFMQADPLARDNRSCTAMHYAAATGALPIIQLLAQPPQPGRHRLLDMANERGFTPLHFAAWHRQHKAVALLCELGAALDSRTFGDFTSGCSTYSIYTGTNVGLPICFWLLMCVLSSFLLLAGTFCSIDGLSCSGQLVACVHSAPDCHRWHFTARHSHNTVHRPCAADPVQCRLHTPAYGGNDWLPVNSQGPAARTCECFPGSIV